MEYGGWCELSVSGFPVVMEAAVIAYGPSWNTSLYFVRQTNNIGLGLGKQQRMSIFDTNK